MESGQSEIRNKTLAPVFKMLGIIEKWCNGLKLIANELKKYSDVGLSWKEPGMAFRVIFYKKVSMVDEDEDIRRQTTMKVREAMPIIETNYRATIEKKTTVVKQEKTTLKTSEKIIQLLKLNPKLSSHILAEIIGNITLGGINHHLKRLSKQGKVMHAGPFKGGYWIVLE